MPSFLLGVPLLAVGIRDSNWDMKTSGLFFLLLGVLFPAGVIFVGMIFDGQLSAFPELFDTALPFQIAPIVVGASLLHYAAALDDKDLYYSGQSCWASLCVFVICCLKHRDRLQEHFGKLVRRWFEGLKNPIDTQTNTPKAAGAEKVVGAKIEMVTIAHTVLTLIDLISDVLFIQQVNAQLGTTSGGQRHLNYVFLITSSVFVLLPIFTNILLITFFGDVIKETDASKISIYSVGCWYFTHATGSQTFNQLHGGNSELCTLTQSMFFFLFPVHCLVQLGMYLLVLTNSELCYMFYGKPEYFTLMTSAGIYIEDIPQFALQLAYAIITSAKYGQEISVYQWLSFALTFWHFGFSASYKWITFNKPPPRPMSDSWIKKLEAVVEIASNSA